MHTHIIGNCLKQVDTSAYIFEKKKKKKKKKKKIVISRETTGKI